MSELRYVVESQFEYNGLYCFVLFYEHGRRCGYVVVPKSNLIYGLACSDIFSDTYDFEEVDYSQPFKDQFNKCGFAPEIFKRLYGQWVLGFSYYHVGYTADFDALEKYFPDSEEFKCKSGRDGEVVTMEQVIDSCKKLADEILATNNKIMKGTTI